MSDELKARFPEFLKVFVDLANSDSYADLHIGVITSDYGAGSGFGMPGMQGCDASPGGQRGRLQALGADADPSCIAPLGVPFIKYNLYGDDNLPSGQDLATTFTCMASVGSKGCGFEHQLESVYAALTNANGGNEGFLRDDARLMVVFITNEDDVSAPPSSRLFDPSLGSFFGFPDSYRQTQYGMECDGNEPPYGATSGPLQNCVPAPQTNGLEYDITRYIGLLTLPYDYGGIKNDPNDVFVGAILSPPSPVEVILSNGDSAPAQPGCPMLDEYAIPACVPTVRHSCQNAQNPDFFGDPTVRLTTVVEEVPNHSIASICDDDYTGAMQAFSFLIASKVGGCLPWDVDLAAPDCDVTDLLGSVDEQPTVTPLAQCDASGSTPCWKVAPQPWCAQSSPQSLALAVHRGGVRAPDGTTTRVVCRSTPRSSAPSAR